MRTKVYMCYRRSGGDVMAEWLAEALEDFTSGNLEVMMDIFSMRAGNYVSQIGDMIDECDNFLLVLSPGALDPCTEEEDWLRIELAYALSCGKNIVPVFADGFEFPEDLPEDICAIKYLNGVSLPVNTNPLIQRNMIRRLVDFIGDGGNSAADITGDSASSGTAAVQPESAAAMEKTVFISYSSREISYAREVRKVLENSGFTCWIANDDLEGSYTEQIPQKIKESTYFVLLVSEKAMQSVWISKELDCAVMWEKTIIPIKIEPCELSSKFEFYLRPLSICNLYEDKERVLKNLICNLRTFEKMDRAVPETELVPYSGDENYIFVSYSHMDSDRVLPIIHELQKKGYRVWYDEGIDPGTEWYTFVAKRLKSCGYFIPMVSENFLASENCKDEVSYACDLAKKRLTIYLEEVHLPEGLEMRLNRHQAIHKYRYTDDLKFFEKLYLAEGLASCCSGI